MLIVDMGWRRIWQQKVKDMFNFVSPIEVFHLLALTILSLVLPISFLVLARRSLSVSASVTWFHINPSSILYVVVSIVSVATLIHSLTTKTTLLKPPLYATWILLCIFQICVGLSIQGIIAGGNFEYNDDDKSDSDSDTRFGFERVIFVVGLHETTQVWSRMVVKPVVDDTVFGISRNERWVERVVVAAGIGGLWWWRLREEVDSLVVVMAESNTEQMMMNNIELSDFVGWWLYYLTLIIGMVRLVKALVWMAIMPLTLCTTRPTSPSLELEPFHNNDDKV